MKPWHVATIVCSCCLLFSACISLPPDDAATNPAADVRRACAGVPDELREAGPLTSPDLVERVEPFRVSEVWSKVPVTALVGARIHVRARPGLAAPWLQRVAACHLARHALPMPEAECAHCPFSSQIARVDVEPLGGSFVISIRAENAEDAEDIWVRANALLARSPQESAMTTAER